MTALTTTRIVRDVLTLSATDRASTVLLDAALHVLRTKSATFDAIRQVAVAVGSDRAKHDFNLILRKMFADGVINWGRIVVMFALAIDVQYSRAIDLQLETALFVEANLSEWLVDQGGWDAVIPVFDVLLPTTSLASSTPSIAVVIAVTAFVATLVTAVLLQTI